MLILILFLHRILTSRDVTIIQGIYPTQILSKHNPNKKTATLPDATIFAKTILPDYLQLKPFQSISRDVYASPKIRVFVSRGLGVIR